MNLSLRVVVALIACVLCSAAPPDDRLNHVSPETRQSPATRQLEHFNRIYPDGSYEYRYELDDGQARYERGYFLNVDKVKTLVVVGYYAYRLDDGRYITVFYNADQNGFRQNQSISKQANPDLPMSIEVPAYDEEVTETPTQQSYFPSTRRPKSTNTKIK